MSATDTMIVDEHSFLRHMNQLSHVIITFSVALMDNIFGATFFPFLRSIIETKKVASRGRYSLNTHLFPPN